MDKQIKDIENSLGGYSAKFSLTRTNIEDIEANTIEVEGKGDELLDLMVNSMFKSEGVAELMTEAVGRFLTMKMLGTGPEDDGDDS